MSLRAAHLGTATLILEVGPLRLLTDPALDPPGQTYGFGFGTRSTKTRGPAIAAEDIGAIDAVLLSHDHHADNLDDAGRAFLPRAGAVLTTRSGARRLGGETIGLADWQSHTLRHASGFELKVTATPARHGPIGSRPIVGEVIGFALEWEGAPGAVYISGDTVYFRGIEAVAERFDVRLAFLHIGGVRFPWLTGPLRYTFDSREAIKAAQILDPELIIPIHYEGWTHFREAPDALRAALSSSAIAERVRWLPAGAAFAKLP